MSVKRQATTELNHENWDQEDPADQEEESGFKMASKEVLEKRVIRTAKRRSQATGDEAKKSVFSGFSGFNKTQQSSFDFLANLTNGNKANNAMSANKSDVTEASNSNNDKPATSPSSNIFGLSGTSTPLVKSTFAKQNTESPIFGSFSQTASAPKPNSTGNDNPFKSQSIQNSTLTSELTSKTNDNAEKTVTQRSSTIFGSSTGVANSPKSPFTASTSNNSSPFKTPPVTTSQPIVDNKTDTKPAVQGDSKSIYYGKLKGLNQSVSAWIKKHVDESPICILTPIFRDYEKHLNDIQSEYEKSKNKNVSKENTDTNSTKQNNAKQNLSTQPNSNIGSSLFSTTKSSTLLSSNISSTPEKPSNFKFGINTSSTVSSTNTFSTSTNTFSISTNTFSKSMSTFSTSTSTFSTPTSTFSSSISTFSTSTTPSTGFSLGVKPSTTTSSPFAMNTINTGASSTPFSFGTGKPFSFNANIKKPEEPANNKEDNEDEPPKVEYTPIVEDNSVFDKKCKVFVKKDGNFTDMGVGTLYIKKIEESGKYQLLVRANTTLGNILLNFILSSSITTQRMGKNNVMMVCIPTPDAKPEPTPILIRVKTSEEADELLETLNKYKV